jgi:hypothetical protein
LRRKLWLPMILLVITAILASGCGAPAAISPLSEQDKDEMVAIALADPEVSRWIDTGDTYDTQVGWSAVGWNGEEATGYSIVEYGQIADGQLPTDRVFPSGATINPHVYIRVNQPTGMHLHVTFDRKEMKVLAVQLMPGRGMGPELPE